jgi:hypothetical protein
MDLVHGATYWIEKFLKHGFDPNGEVKLRIFGRYLVVAITIQAFAFNCHTTVGPTFHRLINLTRKR